MKSVVVIGGGIAGLSAAWHVKQQFEAAGEDVDLHLLEASSRVGGKIKTTRENGFVMEHGPDSFITQKPQALALAKDLGLEDQLIPCYQKKQNVFIAMEDGLHALPKGFRLLAPTRIIDFLRSDLFTWKGKLRALREPWIPAKTSPEEESITDFVQRRLGKEILDRAAGPILSGIYNGEPDQLSIQATFPMLPALEKKYGSLVWGFRQSMKNSPKNAPPMFMSFKEGMQTLSDRLASRLETYIELDSPVQRLEKNQDEWKVTTSRFTLDADHIILALPPAPAAELLSPFLSSEQLSPLSGIHCRTSLAISLGFNASTRITPTSLEGFGFVTHNRENRELTACTWSSTKFHPHRAPKDHDLIRIFMAGDQLTSDMGQPDEYWVQKALEEIAPWMTWDQAPVMTQVTRWPQSNPQYTLGHMDRMNELQQSLRGLKGLQLIGGAYAGVGLPDCIRQGENAASQCL